MRGPSRPFKRAAGLCGDFYVNICVYTYMFVGVEGNVGVGLSFLGFP